MGGGGFREFLVSPLVGGLTLEKYVDKGMLPHTPKLRGVGLFGILHIPCFALFKVVGYAEGLSDIYHWCFTPGLCHYISDILTKVEQSYLNIWVQFRVRHWVLMLVICHLHIGGGYLVQGVVHCHWHCLKWISPLLQI